MQVSKQLITRPTYMNMWRSWDIKCKNTDVLPSKKKKKSRYLSFHESLSCCSTLATAMEAGWRLNHLFDLNKVHKLILAAWVKLYWLNNYPKSGGKHSFCRQSERGLQSPFDYFTLLSFLCIQSAVGLLATKAVINQTNNWCVIEDSNYQKQHLRHT